MLTEDDHNIMELCFHNGKEEGRKEVKAELISRLMNLQVGAHWPECAVLSRIIKMVEGL